MPRAPTGGEQTLSHSAVGSEAQKVVTEDVIYCGFLPSLYPRRVFGHIILVAPVKEAAIPQ